MAETSQHTSHPGNSRPTETEPLLGRPGDASQQPGAPMFKNLYLGTGWLAQIGTILLVVVIWEAVFSHKLIPLFSPHPLLQSLGVFTLSQAILILQPTHTPETKLLGARAHALLHLLSFLIFVAGVTIIEVNKEVNHLAHFHSVHAYLGVATGVVMIVQYIFGFLMWGVPAVFGGIDNAKALWKYHRLSGYLAFILVLSTVVSAMKTTYIENVLHVSPWGVYISVALLVLGIFPRIQLSKLGFSRAH